MTTTKTVTVIVDGNNHNLQGQNGSRAIIETNVENNTVTIEKCREVAKNVEGFGHKARLLEFLLSEFDDDGRYTLNKKAVYHIEEDRLVVWENGVPVYEDHSGTICDDAATLADCLL